MMCQKFGLLIDHFGKALFENRRDSAVQLLPPRAEQGSVGGVLHQRVLEQMGTVNLTMGIDLFSDDRAASCSAADAALITAMSIAPRYAAAHMILGAVYLFTARATQGIAECKQFDSMMIPLVSKLW
jgi:hypothetical protein